MPRLKVYEADIDGLHQWIVAAPNQRAALDALGVRQDLFAQGLARVSDDPAAQAAGQAAPGEPLRRLKGSSAKFRPAGAGGQRGWEQAAAALGKPPAKPKQVDRAGLDRAEAALAGFEAEAVGALDALVEERARLEEREEKLKAVQAAERQRLSRALEKARAAYLKAGGRP